MRRRKFRFLATTLVVAAGLAAASGAGLAESDAIYPNPKEPEMTPRLQLGVMNYAVYCAFCHGKAASGSESGPTFIHRIYQPGHHTDGHFFAAAKNGTIAHHWKFGDMPPVEEANDTQLELIVEYIRAVQRANGLF